MQKRCLKGQQGQTTVEYVLLMMVIMITVVAIVFAFSKSAQSFIANYWGDYFQCLLETGELPTLGSQTTSNNACEDSFQPFTFNAGRPPIDNSVNNSGGANSNANNADANTNSKAGNAADGEGGSKFNTDGGDGFGSGHNREIALSKADKGGSGDEEGGRKFYNFARSDGDDGSDQDRSKLVPTGIYFPKNVDGENKDKSIAAGDAAKEKELKPRRVPANLDKKPTKPDEQESGMTLPDFLRWLFIIGIILAIVIFFGNQIMQFKKSQSD